MSSRFCIAFLIIKIFGAILALTELPQVDKNNILETDKSIRETTNKLFSILRLKINESPALKQYSLIHNYLVSTSLQDYTNLIEIAKLTRVDKIKLNNQTTHFMAILNEILNEDIKHDTEIEDGYVIEHIEAFIKNLDKYTDSYEYNEYNVNYIVAEILKLLAKNETFSEEHFHDTLDTDKHSRESFSKNNTLVNENEFWEPSGRRIYSGRKTTIKDFPFIASIQIFNHFQCAGSIIKSDLIITAASCLQLAWNNRFFRENPAFLSARVGSTFHNAGGETIPILEVNFHPGYDPPSLRNNLAITRLYRVLKFSKKVKKLKKIVIDRHANALPFNTRGITIVGWGARKRSNVIEDPYLSFAVLDFYDLQECQDVYSKQYVTKKHFCAGSISVGSGACNRDIGGPGITRGVLTGIVSFGSPVCGTPDAPTVFTKLGYYSEWIDGIMDKEVPKAKRKTTTFGYPIFNMVTDYEQTKTTFKILPPVFSKKPKLLNEFALRKPDNQGQEFVNSLVGIKEADNLLRDATLKNKVTVSPKHDVIERIPYTYIPVTTLEPPELPSTKMNDIQEEAVEINDKRSVKELFNTLIGNKEFENLLREATKTTEINTPNDHLVEQIPFTYYPVTAMILDPSNAMGVMKADDTPEVTFQKSFEAKDKKNNNKNRPDKHDIQEKDKELNAKLEQDIINILDEINLEDYLIKERKSFENKNNSFTIKNDNKNIKDIFTLLYLSDSEQKDITGILSGESEGSHEGGMEIIADIFKNVSHVENKTEDIFDSDKELFQIVTDVLKEELIHKFTDKNLSTKTEENEIKIQSRNDEPQKFANENKNPVKSVHQL